MANIFDQFTKKYSLSKTLRFELRAVGNTAQMLEDEGVFAKDRIKKEKYEQTKPYFNQLHCEVIKESLSDKAIDNLPKYFSALKKLQKNKKDEQVKKKFNDVSKELRTQVNGYFNTEKLFGAGVFDELKERYGKEEGAFLKNEDGEFILDEQGEKVSIFDDWKGFTSYFDKFQETRKNFYKDDGTATAIATRIIDNNLKRFCENIQLFESIKDKIDFKEVEKGLSVDLNQVFSLDYYNLCMLQEGIDQHNKILGGYAKESGEKIKGLNEIINKYRQDNRGEKSGFFKLLDKQILSEKNDFIENIKDDEELLERLGEFYASAEEKTNNLKNLLNYFFENFSEYDLEELGKIYISKEAINTILYKWMSNDGLEEFQKIAHEQTKKEKIVKFDKNDNSYKFPDFINLLVIKNALEGKYNNEKIWKERYFVDESNSQPKGFLAANETKWEQFLKIFQFEFDSLFYKEAVDKREKTGYEVFKEGFREIIERKTDDFSVSPEDKLTIKNFVDNTLWIYQMGKYFALEKKRKWLDEYDAGDFYDHPERGYKTTFYNDAYKKIVKARMLLQSYLTKKPFNTEKWKLTFENPTLADGWDKNKETDNTAVVLHKDGHYYLGVIDKKNNNIFENIPESDLKDAYEKMVYKAISDPVKDLPNLMVINGKTVRKTGRKDKKTGINHVLEELKNKYLPEEINSIRKSGSYLKSSENFNKKDSQKYLAYYMQRLIEYKTDEFVFEFKNPEEYSSYSEFSADVGQQGYKIGFVNVSKDYVDSLNQNGKLYLFEIHNKDWNLKDGKQKTGNKNMHTLYFESLFSDINKKKNFPFKLNGEAELFYRPKTDEEKLGAKLDKKGNRVIDHKRYSEDKVFLHLPITLNRTVGDIYNFNQEVNGFFINNPDINIIGLDRGEKHLIYYAGIDQNGNLLKDKDGKEVLGSLNEINGVNYYKLLEERAKGREKARQDWQSIEGIKDLKRGYISLVVRKLADLMIEHSAIIILEDLNMRFKQIRGGIEKSVYQQLEKALIEKLNFLVNKGEKDPEKAGHLLRAYQLTAPFTTFRDMGKQTGVIFYTQAGYTSKTCPECGFRPNVKWDQENLLEKIQIEYADNAFTTSYRVSDFVQNKNASKRGNILFTDFDAKNNFVISTKDAVRYRWFRRGKKDSELKKGEEKLPEQTEKGITIKYDITECIEGLLKRGGVDLRGDLKKQISEKISTKKFFKDLSYYLYLLSNTRISVSGTDIDYINCPDCGFHSEQKFKGVEFNGDANGAYNVARKGIMILKKIGQYYREHNNSLDKMSWGDLFIDIEEWDKFAQNNKPEKSMRISDAKALKTETSTK